MLPSPDDEQRWEFLSVPRIRSGPLVSGTSLVGKDAVDALALEIAAGALYDVLNRNVTSGGLIGSRAGDLGVSFYTQHILGEGRELCQDGRVATGRQAVVVLNSVVEGTRGGGDWLSGKIKSVATINVVVTEYSLAWEIESVAAGTVVIDEDWRPW